MYMEQLGIQHLMEDSIQMIKCKLAEFYSSKGYAFEILESNKFAILQMDDKWKEHFLTDIVNDENGCWEITDCELEPILQDM